MNCNLCPRHCGVDRNYTTGFCEKNSQMEISKVMLHYGEEPYLAKNGPSGAIFFAGCNLKCVYCQNYQISRGKGKIVTVEKLVSLFKQLQAAGAKNIDLVTPTHYSHLILQALTQYKPSIPVIYNCGGYENPQIIEKLCEKVDIFLFDLKYFDSALATKYSNAPNYFEYATKSILAAKGLKKDKFNEGQLIEGVVIRHLCLPSHSSDSKKILDWIKVADQNMLVSIMSQFVPMNNLQKFPEINRPLKPLEYKIVVNYAKKLGLNNSLVQELSSATTAMLPNFYVQDKQFKF